MQLDSLLFTNLIVSIPTSARLYKSTGFGSRVLVMPNEAPSSFVFVFIDSWKRQRVRLTAFYIKVSLLLVGILDGFFMLFRMRFLTGTVRHRKELTRQQDKNHRVVSYNHTIPRWCSGQLKYENFIAFISISLQRT